MTEGLNPLFLAITDWEFRGFGLLVLLLLVVVLIVILARGKPRQEVQVVVSDPPLRNPRDPAFVRRRARAAAAATVFHRKRHASGELDEDS